MFNQIVYTRCALCRDLFDNGKIRNQEGYAIRTFSPEIYNDCDINTLEKIQKYMKTRNESKTGTKAGLFDSFEYFPLNFSYVIGCEHQISKARRTTYVKHYYVGDIQEYPIHYLNGDLFSYCHKEEKDFIGENETLEFAPVVDFTPTAFFTKEAASRFYQDGRQDAIESCISFLVEQYKLPLQERQFLIIKDTPENVLKWIACIEYALPLELAKMISFSTNTNITKTTPKSYRYYTDEQNSFYENNLKGDTNLIQNYYFMIAGIHPEGSHAHDFQPMPNAPYVIVDGVKKQAEFEIAKNSNYLQLACQYNQDFEDFQTILKDCQNYSYQTLYDLFDAYMYILDDEQDISKWEYTKLLESIQCFSKFLVSGSKTEKMLVDFIYGEYISHKSIWLHDEQNNLQIIKLLIQFINNLQDKQYKEHLHNFIFQMITYITNIKHFTKEKAMMYWQMVNTSKELSTYIYYEFFNEQRIDSKYMKQYCIEDLDYLIFFIQLFNHYLESFHLDASLLKEHPKWNTLLNHLFATLLELEDNQELYAIDKLIENYDNDLMNFFTIQYAKKYGSKHDITKKWVTFYGKCISGDLENQCQTMLLSGIDISTVEILLVNYLENKKILDQDLFHSFLLLYKNLQVHDDEFGDIFFRKCIEIALLQTQPYKSIKDLIDFIIDYQFPTQIKHFLLDKVDAIIHPVVKDINELKFIEYLVNLQVDYFLPRVSKAQFYVKVTHQVKQAKQLDEELDEQCLAPFLIETKEDLEYVDAIIEPCCIFIETPEMIYKLLNVFKFRNSIEFYHYVQSVLIYLIRKSYKNKYLLKIILEFLGGQVDDKKNDYYSYEDMEKAFHLELYEELSKNYHEKTWEEMIDLLHGSLKGTIIKLNESVRKNYELKYQRKSQKLFKNLKSRFKKER